ncbi:MAG: hypothetical protein KME16_06130 [Scytolyngbya sp. HA4215-MV1]|jgi:carbon dioxide concentrating mechanism protein CcmN|nr:hypothetical protein [Scytolyngbya sp. HA4215-MV1]
MPTSYYYHISGDVTIHESATIAPGVILQADPNSRIIIESGVCIGSGSVLHAHEGTLEIAQSVTIGTKVLLIGKLKIGANACIGSASTLFNCSLEAGQVIPPDSLLGNCGRQVEVLETADTAIPTPGPEQSVSPDSSSSDDSQTTAEWSVFQASGKVQGKVYGQVYVSRIIAKMMPNSKQFGTPQDNQPQS